MQRRIFFRTAAALLAVAVGLWVSPWATALAPESAGQETVISALYDAMDEALQEQQETVSLPVEEPAGDTGAPRAATDTTPGEINVSIEWGSMEFAYGSTWDPETLTYTKASGWTSYNAGDRFTVKNGGTAVNVAVAYEKASVNGIEGTLYTVKDTQVSKVSGTQKFEMNDSQTYQLKLTGTPEKIMTTPTTVGTITVTVTRSDTGTENTLSIEDTTEAVS